MTFHGSGPRDRVQGFWCPACDAHPGRPCVSRAGEPTTPHTAREMLSRGLVASGRGMYRPANRIERIAIATPDAGPWPRGGFSPPEGVPAWVVTFDDDSTRECLDAAGVMRCAQIRDAHACERAGDGVVRTRVEWRNASPGFEPPDPAAFAADW